MGWVGVDGWVGGLDVSDQLPVNTRAFVRNRGRLRLMAFQLGGGNPSYDPDLKWMCR